MGFVAHLHDSCSDFTLSKILKISSGSQTTSKTISNIRVTEKVEGAKEKVKTLPCDIVFKTDQINKGFIARRPEDCNGLQN